MKLIKTFEKFRNKQNQVIELSCEVSSKEDTRDLAYDDYRADLYINGKFIADISPVLDAAGLFTDMVDSVDWEQLYAEQFADLKHAS